MDPNAIWSFKAKMAYRYVCYIQNSIQTAKFIIIKELLYRKCHKNVRHRIFLNIYIHSVYRIQCSNLKKRSIETLPFSSIVVIGSAMSSPTSLRGIVLITVLLKFRACRIASNFCKVMYSTMCFALAFRALQ